METSRPAGLTNLEKELQAQSAYLETNYRGDIDLRVEFECPHGKLIHTTQRDYPNPENTAAFEAALKKTAQDFHNETGDIFDDFQNPDDFYCGACNEEIKADEYETHNRKAW